MLQLPWWEAHIMGFKKKLNWGMVIVKSNDRILQQTTASRCEAVSSYSGRCTVAGSATHFSFKRTIKHTRDIPATSSLISGWLTPSSHKRQEEKAD